MRHIKLILLKLLVPAVLFLLAALPNISFAAANDLIVQFEAAPLFSNTSLIPGSTATRYAVVRNNLSGSQNIATEAIFVNDPSNLGSVINFSVREGSPTSTPLVSKPLSEFFAQGETFLSVLPAFSTTTYYFTVEMYPTTSEAFSSTSLGFDLVVGFQGALTPPPTSPGGGVSGGGGGNPPPGLTILNERAGTTNITATSGLIIWSTSYKSTSRVVYGTTPAAFTYATDTLSNYGYAFSSAEFDTPAATNGVLNHAVLLTGLTPATTYYFRAISHASPDTVSREFSFETLALESPSANNGFTENNQTAAVTLLASADADVAPINTSQTDTPIPTTPLPQNNSLTTEEPPQLNNPPAESGDEDRGLLANLLSAISSVSLLGYILISVIILSLIFLLRIRKKRKKYQV